MYLKSIEIVGFKSFAKKSEFVFSTPITSIVGPNGSGKSNIAEAFRFVLGEQSMKSLRGKRGEDLIFSGTHSAPRASRASVRIVFDNRPQKISTGEDGENKKEETKRLFSLEYDEVSIERAVYRDGTNEYRINGSVVRLRDILELLAEANIGATGHHIISQGEADRILSASPRERKAMIEDALGLKVYQYKKIESEKKLAKTIENKAQVELLRKENAPHLRFLERQMQKLERARELREVLKKAYADYLKRECIYLEYTKRLIATEKANMDAQLFKTEQLLQQKREALSSSVLHDKKSDELLSLEQNISRVRAEKDDLFRALGRLEGEIAAEERRLSRLVNASLSENVVPYVEVERFFSNILEKLSNMLPTEASSVSDFFSDVVFYIKSAIKDFLNTYKGNMPDITKEEKVLNELREKYVALKEKSIRLKEKEDEFQRMYRELQSAIENNRTESREIERELFSLMNEETKQRAELEKIHTKERALAREEEEWKREFVEAGALLSGDALLYKTFDIFDENGFVLSERVIAYEKRDYQ